MDYIFIKTKNNCFIVEKVENSIADKNNIINGRCMILKCNQAIQKNGKKITSYTNYISSPVFVCHEQDVLEKRTANKIEKDIFNSIDNNIKLSDNNRSYLQQNFLNY